MCTFSNLGWQTKTLPSTPPSTPSPQYIAFLRWFPNPRKTAHKPRRRRLPCPGRFHPGLTAHHTRRRTAKTTTRTPPELAGCRRHCPAKGDHAAAPPRRRTPPPPHCLAAAAVTFRGRAPPPLYCPRGRLHCPGKDDHATALPTIERHVLRDARTTTPQPLTGEIDSRRTAHGRTPQLLETRRPRCRTAHRSCSTPHCAARRRYLKFSSKFLYCRKI